MRILRIYGTILLVLVGITTQAQRPIFWSNKIHTPTQYDKLKVDSVDIMPRDTLQLGPADSGAHAYKGGKEWLWNGYLWKQNSATGGGSGSGFSFRTLHSSAFSTATNCPLPALDDDSLQIFWNDLGRFLVKGTDWTPLAGGGFTVLISGFDSGDADYSFTVYASSGSLTPGPLPVTSADFSTGTNCPIPSLNGMNLQIFWNDLNRYLTTSEWTPLAGGGFTITIPGFNATSSTYSFYVFNQ